jgi:hypothetical protein
MVDYTEIIGLDQNPAAGSLWLLSYFLVGWDWEDDGLRPAQAK